MLLSRLDVTDCEWLLRLLFALAEGQRAGQSLSKYRTIFLRWNSVEATSPARDLMWTFEGVGRQHMFLEHVPWLQNPVGLLKILTRLLALIEHLPLGFPGREHTECLLYTATQSLAAGVLAVSGDQG